MPASGFGVTVLHRADARASPADLDLPKGRYGFGVSWDTVRGRSVDIDLQCVVVDKAGSIIDCAYYNNLKAAGAITHSGDEAQGKPDNIEEMIWVNMRKVQQNVGLLVFVVAAYSGGKLQDVANGKLHVLEERQSNEIALFEMERSAASVDVVAAMYRQAPGRGSGAAWQMGNIIECALCQLPTSVIMDGEHGCDLTVACDNELSRCCSGRWHNWHVRRLHDQAVLLDPEVGLVEVPSCRCFAR